MKRALSDFGIITKREITEFHQAIGESEGGECKISLKQLLRLVKSVELLLVLVGDMNAARDQMDNVMGDYSGDLFARARAIKEETDNAIKPPDA